MKSLPLFLYLLVGAWAQAEIRVNYGFYPSNSPEISSTVRAVQDKIFKVIAPRYISVKTETVRRLLNQEGAITDPAVRKMFEKCDLSGESDLCWLLSGEENGTAFLDEDPRFIWTNCHIVRPWMNYASRNENITSKAELRSFFTDKEVPLQLFDANQRRIYDGSEQPAYLRVYAVAMNWNQTARSCDSKNDLVKIELGAALASNGLKWRHRKNPPKSSDNLYLGGFPRETSNRERLGRRDSDGKSFFWTKGPYLEKKSSQYYEFLESHPDHDLLLSVSYAESLFADSVEGLSGSPVLNEAGEVVGIFRGFLPVSDEEKDRPYISLFISTGGMRFVEILSGE